MMRAGSLIQKFFLVSVLIILVLASAPTATWAKATYDLVIHYVLPTAKDGAAGVNVQVFFSVIDENNKLQKDLEAGDFIVTENGTGMTIDSLAQVQNEPLSVVLVLDTSGAGPRVEDQRKAATDFVQNLERDDSVGVVTFNDETKTVVDLTTDHDEALDKLKKVQAVPQKGNCFYDAVYSAVELLAKQPAGRRSVVAFSDSPDREYDTSKECSSHTVDDVIDLASEWNTRAPIYTVAITEASDEKTLERMAQKTGGRYRFSENSGDVRDILNDLSNQFQNEYIITYTSLSPAGEYSLVVEVDHSGSKDQDTRKMFLPEGGKAAAEEGQPTKESGQSRPQGTQAAAGPQATQTPLSALPLLPTAESPAESSGGLGSMLPLILVGVLGIAGLIVLLVIIAVIRGNAAKKKKKTHAPSGPVAPPPSSSEATVDNMVLGAMGGAGAFGPQMGTLTVLNSDDPSMVNKVLTINSGRTTLGRSPDNDIILPQDKPVSREHAILEQMGSKIYIAEAISQNADGSPKRPAYGTFVNEQRVEGLPIELHAGDVIRLGSRFSARVELFAPDASSAATVDGLIISESDATMDGSVPDSDRTVEFHG